MTLSNGHSINLSAWIRFSLLLLAASAAYWRMDARINKLEELPPKVESMNNNVTHIEELTRRVNNQDTILNLLVPKVERVDTNVLVLMTRTDKGR